MISKANPTACHLPGGCLSDACSVTDCTSWLVVLTGLAYRACRQVPAAQQLQQQHAPAAQCECGQLVQPPFRIWARRRQRSSPGKPPHLGGMSCHIPTSLHLPEEMSDGLPSVSLQPLGYSGPHATGLCDTSATPLPEVSEHSSVSLHPMQVHQILPSLHINLACCRWQVRFYKQREPVSISPAQAVHHSDCSPGEIDRDPFCDKLPCKARSC